MLDRHGHDRLGGDTAGQARLFPGILHHAPEGADAVFPADLFTFFVGASGVADAHFENTQAPLGDFHGDLRFEAEAVFFKRDGLDHVSPEDLVAGFHVGEIQIGERVREQCKQLVADGMPKIEHAVRTASHEARPVDHVGFAFDQGFQKERVLGRIVFEVSVLNDNEVAAGFLNAAAQGCALAHVARLQQHTQRRPILLFQGSKDLAGGVGRAVVDAEQFDLEGELQRKDTVDHEAQGGALVVDGHDHG